MNIYSADFIKKSSDLLGSLGNPTRVQILLAIGEGEACVCHLETVLGQRQAYISQHLMALRKAGVLESRRDGRFIFYRLHDPGILNLVYQAASLTGVSELKISTTNPQTIDPECDCPYCAQS